MLYHSNNKQHWLLRNRAAPAYQNTPANTVYIGGESSERRDVYVHADTLIFYSKVTQPIPVQCTLALPQTLPPHQPVLLEATDSVCDTRRWGNGASRPGMRLSTATSGFPFQMCKTPVQRRIQRLVCKTPQKLELRMQLSESFSNSLISLTPVSYIGSEMLKLDW